MASHTLTAQTRAITGKYCRELINNRRIPSILYGKKVNNQNVSVARSEFEKVYASAGASSIVNLAIEDNTSVPVLIHDVARDPRSNSIIHIDFYQVNMMEKLTAHIPLKFAGESKAVKELGGILMKNIKNLEVKCLPKDLVSEIVVDIAMLETFNDSIKIKDLSIPSGIEVIANPESIVTAVSSPMSEEELKKSLEGKPAEDVEAVKVEEKGKKEDEEKAIA